MSRSSDPQAKHSPESTTILSCLPSSIRQSSAAMSVDHTIVAKKAGNGYPCNWTPEESDAEYRGELFPNALVQVGSEGAVLQPITLRELMMLRFMNRVTDEGGWTTKVFDKTVIPKWKEKTVDLPDSGIAISEQMFTYCISELQYRATEHATSPNGAIRVFNGDVYKSDTAVSEETKLALQKAVRVLEDVPESQKDWHPGSDGKVLDLVHPSMFPLIYGKSKVLPVGARVTTLEDCIKRCGEGDVLTADTSNRLEDDNAWSDQFQWLPCEVDISGEKPRILTYINSLHPEHHRELYSLIEDIIHASIPLWERTVIPSNDLGSTPKRIEYDFCKYDVPIEDGEDDPLEREMEWIERNKVLEPTERFNAKILKRNPLSFKDRFGEFPLQVIVKLANIELTPENPEYEGGTWHVEGKRQEEDYDVFLDDVFGLNNWSDSIQNIGSIDTREGRLITFPSILQYQVEPFQLADPTKPGHRKILALFLVDPNVRVISTADVPCQRQDWWWDEMLKVTSTPSQPSRNPSFTDAEATAGIHKLPSELQKLVFDDVKDFPVSMDKAKEYREKLMEERKTFVLEHQKEFAAQTIALRPDKYFLGYLW
ncbi:hypothetical protein H1R20_g3586, partial [Candolleomyces eurysporus]